MIRQTALVAIVLGLAPSWADAQTTQFTVTVETAKIYKAPSTGSAVVGEVQRGTIFEVTRELGSWVRIPWPAAPDGAAFVHVSWGTLIHRLSPDSVNATGAAAPRSGPASASRPAGSGPIGRTVASPAPSGALYIVPPTHLIGLGGRIAGSKLGVGGTARAWSRGRLGIQFEMSRSQITTVGVPGRLTSLEIVPSVLYAPVNRVSDSVWLRPYLGAGAGLYRQILSTAPAVLDAASDTSLGFQGFGGAELSLPSVPRLAIGADVGYRRVQTPFAGFELGGVGFSVSAHWYLR